MKLSNEQYNEILQGLKEDAATKAKLADFAFSLNELSYQSVKKQIKKDLNKEVMEIDLKQTVLLRYEYIQAFVVERISIVKALL